MAIDLGNLAALRTFRVLRALKTVAVVPGKSATASARKKSCNNNHTKTSYTLYKCI